MKRLCRYISVLLSLLCLPLLATLLFLSETMPQHFQVTRGKELQLGSLITADNAAVQTGAIRAGTTVDDSYFSTLRLLGMFPIKDITVNVVERRVVIPCGTPFGIKLYTKGVLVVGMSDVDTSDGSCNPARLAGIKSGDCLLEIDGQAVSSNEEVAALVESSGGKPMTFRIERDGLTFSVKFTPLKSTAEQRYKAGLWVRDSSAGIGTMTFYDPDTGAYGGLGHGICDVDTGCLLPISTGEIVPAAIYSVTKGVSGTPGELHGNFGYGAMGSLTINGDTGVFGKLRKTLLSDKALPIALKQEIHTGEAEILTTLDNSSPRRYAIRIEQISYNDLTGTRNMVIRITDSALLEKTGGIVQGMSGSPILQDGRLVGAVTHVFVGDPAKGYGIFIENMLNTADSVVQQPAA